MSALRSGRKVDINYPGLEPITVTILSEQARVLLPEFVIGDDGELRPKGRKGRIIQFYADPGGMRTVRLDEITVR